MTAGSRMKATTCENDHLRRPAHEQVPGRARSRGARSAGARGDAIAVGGAVSPAASAMLLEMARQPRKQRRRAARSLAPARSPAPARDPGWVPAADAAQARAGKPELLAPAGDADCLCAALQCGADHRLREVHDLQARPAPRAGGLHDAGSARVVGACVADGSDELTARKDNTHRKCRETGNEAHSWCRSQSRSARNLGLWDPPSHLTSGGNHNRTRSRREISPPEVAGTDFIIVRDGRIAAIYLFFDELPRARQGKD
jgi:hypothetical protein